MSYRMSCYTLFDITQTGVLNRYRPNEDDITNWIRQRNTQCNFDTILQVISLRSQPEVVKYPTKTLMKDVDFDKFGFLFQKNEECYCWKFEFEIQHPSVFENGIVPLGALYKDCEGVPMIICETQLLNTTEFLDISDERKNIHFEVL